MVAVVQGAQALLMQVLLAAPLDLVVVAGAAGLPLVVVALVALAVSLRVVAVVEHLV
jgi:hypothetical protein